MKLNISLMKLIIRLTVLMILLVMLFIIGMFMYSAKYWPDVYNYVNANITITRIPTVSELNLTVFKVVEYNTETYSTTESDYDSSTAFDVNTEDYKFSFEDFDFPKSRKKRNAQLEDISNDYREVPEKTVVVDYFFVDDETSTKIIKDLLDEKKLTTRDLEDVEMISDTDHDGVIQKQTISTYGNKLNLTDAIFPWIAAIFVKNDSKDGRFDYICDGALVSDRVLLTAARCVHDGKTLINAENILVILGKKSLQSSGPYEKVIKVKAIKPHANFTVKDDIGRNDLALVILEEAVLYNEGIAPANLEKAGEIPETGEDMEAVTTAWNLFGDLTLIYFDKEKSKACGSDNKVENTFCATYGNDVALCPSYGGLHVRVSSDQQIYLHGIRTGDPQDRVICFGKEVKYTLLRHHSTWIQDVIDVSKVD